MVSGNSLRRALGKLGDQVSQSLLDAGFAFDPKDNACKHSQKEDRYTVWQIPYDSVGSAGHGLRPTIQIELTYASLRLPAVTLALDLIHSLRRTRERPIHDSGRTAFTQSAKDGMKPRSS